MSNKLSNKEILLKANAAIDAGDHESFLAFCTDDTEWDFVGDQVLSGKQAVREYMAANYIVPPVVTIDRFIEEGDFLTVIGGIVLRGKGGEGGEAGEGGMSTHYSYCDVWYFRNGQMASLKAFVIKRDE